MVDDHRLRQILMNLLNNAVKFTGDGKIRVLLSVHEETDTHDRVKVAIKDTGIGMDAEARSRLFQRFSQADSSTSRSYGGTGLGLSICKGLVDLMGGQIGADSAQGEGSTFWFMLSLERTEIAEDEDFAGEGAELSARILLVDDNAANRELAVTLLGMLGCETDTAEDGKAAVEAARTNRYDVILMDVHMPGMDGLEATRLIRAMDGPAAKTPIVAMSADVLPEQVARCRKAGMVDAVGKPINVAQLFDCLARWVGKDSEGQALAA